MPRQRKTAGVAIDTNKHRPLPCLSCGKAINKFRGRIFQTNGNGGPKKPKRYACDRCVRRDLAGVVELAKEQLGGEVTWRR